VFESMVLWRIFGPRTEEVAGGWRRLHNEELHNLYTSPNIRVIQSRQMCLAGLVIYEGVPKSFQSESVTKYMLTTIETC